MHYSDCDCGGWESMCEDCKDLVAGLTNGYQRDYKAGMREVVEWIKGHKVGAREEDGSYSELPYTFWEKELQSQLKKWGLKHEKLYNDSRNTDQ